MSAVRPRGNGNPYSKRDQVLATVRALLADGTCPPGSYLPTQRDLAAEHGVSDGPVRNALALLEREGLIRHGQADRGEAWHRYIVQEQPRSAVPAAGEQRHRPARVAADMVPAVFGQRMRQLREEHGWNLGELAGKISVSASVLSRAENGSGISLTYAARIAEAFGSTLAAMTEPFPCARCRGLPPPGFSCRECGSGSPQPGMTRRPENTAS